jgi:hypothetical protein
MSILTHLINRPDTEDLKLILYTSIILRFITALLGELIGAVVAFFLLIVLWQLRDRHYVGIRLLVLALPLDLIASTVNVISAGMGISFYFSLLLFSVGLLFLIKAKLEYNTLPRPVYTYNKFEKPKARYALKTKDAKDIENISSYKDWNKPENVNVQ